MKFLKGSIFSVLSISFCWAEPALITKSMTGAASGDKQIVANSKDATASANAAVLVNVVDASKNLSTDKGDAKKDGPLKGDVQKNDTQKGDIQKVGAKKADQKVEVQKTVSKPTKRQVQSNQRARKKQSAKPINISFKDGFAPIVDRVIKSVVNISTKQSNSDNQLVRDSLGSGVIIDSKGFIITNSHVIEGDDGEQDISVVFYDGTELKARIIGRDSRADIALLKVDTKKKLTPVKWGNSDKAKVGNWVLAIGNPEGFGNTVTSGIISCRARDLSSKIQEIGGGNDLVDYIQIDAPINSGNSGGPIFNTSGEAIGIVSISVTSTGSNVGLNFAMPSNCVVSAVEQLKKYGKMRRGWIGVQMDELDPEVARSLGLGDLNGSVVSRVVPDSPASKAGLLQGDIIIGINQRGVSNHSLNRIIAESPAGTVVPIRVIRDTDEIVVKVTVEYQDDDNFEDNNGYVVLKNGRGTLVREAGLYIENLSKNTANLLEIPKNITGVVIVRMSSDFRQPQKLDNQSEYKEIRVGDLITRVNQTPVKTVDEFIACVQRACDESDGEKPLALLVYRGGLSFYRAIIINPNRRK